MSNSLVLLSKYRSELMGLAMLFVIYSHIPFPFSYWPLCFTQWNGHFGVDMFLTLSGIGLVYSIRKNNSYLEFYKKRAIRIFPVYSLVNILYLFKPVILHSEKIDLLNVLLTCTTVGYWFDYSYCDWFIPHIVLMYILFPLIWSLVRNVNILYCLVIVLGVWGILEIINIEDVDFYRASYRYLDFFLGVIVGKLIIDDKIQINKYLERFFMVLMLFGALLALYYHWRYATNTGYWINNQTFFKRGYVYCPYVLGGVGVMVLLCYLFVYLEEKASPKLRVVGGKLLRLIGEMSIELYLIHILFIPYSSLFPMPLGAIIMIIVSFSFAYFLHYVNKRMMYFLTLRFINN